MSGALHAIGACETCDLIQDLDTAEARQSWREQHQDHQHGVAYERLWEEAR